MDRVSPMKFNTIFKKSLQSNGNKTFYVLFLLCFADKISSFVYCLTGALAFTTILCVSLALSMFKLHKRISFQRTGKSPCFSEIILHFNLKSNFCCKNVFDVFKQIFQLLLPAIWLEGWVYLIILLNCIFLNNLSNWYNFHCIHSLIFIFISISLPGSRGKSSLCSFNQPER